jgi:hypothetical protein
MTTLLQFYRINEQDPRFADTQKISVDPLRVVSINEQKLGDRLVAVLFGPGVPGGRATVPDGDRQVALTIAEEKKKAAKPDPVG